MNKTAGEAATLISELIPEVSGADCDVVICVPYTDLPLAVSKTAGSNIGVGAQNVHFEKSGAFTGEISADMAKLHPTYKTPVNALVVSAAVSILLVLSRDLGQLTSLVAICGILFNGLTFYSVILLRKKYPTLERPYKVWGYPVLIILVCLVMVGLVINTFVEDPVTSLWGFLVPIVGLVVYELGFKKSREKYLAQKEEEEE